MLLTLVTFLGVHLVRQVGFICAWVPSCAWTGDGGDTCTGHLMMDRLMVHCSIISVSASVAIWPTDISDKLLKNI